MNTLPIILSVAVAFLATFSAGLFATKLKNHIGIVCAFSAGFFIALSIFGLLPDILKIAPSAQISTGQLLAAAVIGFGFLFAVNRSFSRTYMKSHTITKITFQPKVGLLSTAEFCSHAFLEGIAIGVSFQFQFSLGIFVAVAVVAHDFCDGITTLTLMLESGNNLKSSLALLFVDAVAPAFGAAATFIFVFQKFMMVYALSFLLGSFLYMGGGILLPDAYRMNRPTVTVALFLTGFFMILLLTNIIP
jgi:zinc transporter ZupT